MIQMCSRVRASSWFTIALVLVGLLGTSAPAAADANKRGAKRFQVEKLDKELKTPLADCSAHRA